MYKHNKIPDYIFVVNAKVLLSFTQGRQLQLT